VGLCESATLGAYTSFASGIFLRSAQCVYETQFTVQRVVVAADWKRHARRTCLLSARLNPLSWTVSTVLSGWSIAAALSKLGSVSASEYCGISSRFRDILYSRYFPLNSYPKTRSRDLTQQPIAFRSPQLSGLKLSSQSFATCQSHCSVCETFTHHQLSSAALYVHVYHNSGRPFRAATANQALISTRIQQRSKPWISCRGWRFFRDTVCSLSWNSEELEMQSSTPNHSGVRKLIAPEGAWSALQHMVAPSAECQWRAV